MPDFDESLYDAMSDEDLENFLAHDAELPLSLARNTDEALYAASILASQHSAELPDADVELEHFRDDCKDIPFDGGTLWDEPPRFPRAGTAPLQKDAASPRTSAKAPAKVRSAKLSKSGAAKPPLPPIPGSVSHTTAEQRPVSAPSQMRTPHGGSDHSGAGLFAALLLTLMVGLGVFYIRTTMNTMIENRPSPSPSAAGYTLHWVPDGYTETVFTDWDVSGYLYTWRNAAGKQITFHRYPGGTNVAAEQKSAGTRIVSVCGTSGEYCLKDGERSLVFSSIDGRDVYYLEAENVSENDMQKMIDAIR